MNLCSSICASHLLSDACMTRRCALQWLTHLPRHRRFATSRIMAERSYGDAVAALNTLQSNFAIIDAIRKSGKKMNEQAIPEMLEWARKIGYQPSDLTSLNPIHIAGTKGKGSTAAFISSILNQFREAGHGPRKIGLYTSPHLRFVRERIQINGSPLSEEQFAKYFFETWDRLEDAAEKDGLDPKSREAKPVYFRFLTLMAFHAYKSEGVDAAVIECGIGGAYDSTNIIDSPSVTGITNLGIDHVRVLGDTLEEIAWHKAGIMKRGAKCFTTSTQLPEAKEVLNKVANEKGVELVYVDTLPDIASGTTKLGLEADFQKINASLAVAISTEFLAKHSQSTDLETQELIRAGLSQTRWPGRCDVRGGPGTNDPIIWCIDGGHTLDSIRLAGKWFAEKINTFTSSSANFPHQNPTTYLIFNQQTRDAAGLANALWDTLSSTLLQQNSTSTGGSRSPFDVVVFCTNETYKETGFRPDLMSMNTNKRDVDDMKVQKELAEVWTGRDGMADVRVVRTVEEAVETVRGHDGGLLGGKGEKCVLVTGSLHLVGGVLEVLEGEEERRNKKTEEEG